MEPASLARRRLSGESPEPTGKEKTMSWTAPIVIEICAGVEVTAYVIAEM